MGTNKKGIKMKYLITLLFTINLLNGSYLLDKDYPLCIEDYYYQSGSIHYLRSSNLTWSSTSEDHTLQNVHNSYLYDSLTGRCNPTGLNEFGLTVEQFNFLLAFCGLIFGSVFLYFVVDLSVKVGGRR